MSTKTRQKN